MDFGTPGGVGFVLVSPGCVTAQTFVEIERYCFSDVQTTFLEAQLKDNKLDTPEDRQKVAAVFIKETKETFDVERIHTWFRNHKKKNKGGVRGGGWFVK